MSIWDTYPVDYRALQVQAILSAIQAGECVSIVGLSGSGKSNLLGFLAHRAESDHPSFILVDCNRLAEPSLQALFRLIYSTLGETSQADEVSFATLDHAITDRLGSTAGLCLSFDRFDVLPAVPAFTGIASNLRALRDAHKYELTYVTATRRPLDPLTELAELFFAHTLWLGPLAESDARWNVMRYAGRRGLSWDEETIQTILRLSLGYPSFLRATCEACAEGIGLQVDCLIGHPAVRRRLDEFWADHPGQDELHQSGLANHPLLNAYRPAGLDSGQLTAKEHLLWEYFQAHPGRVCEKDELVRAVWPEDKIYEHGIRDDSLAQLVRRLREKVELDPSSPQHIHTIPGRGYRFTL